MQFCVSVDNGPGQHVDLRGGVVGDGPDRMLEWRPTCEGGACVEFAVTDGAIILRISTNPEATITMTLPEWRAFLTEAKNGRFDEL
jgi:hypothetical protein